MKIFKTILFAMLSFAILLAGWQTGMIAPAVGVIAIVKAVDFIVSPRKLSVGLFAIDLGTIASGVGTATAINIQYCPQQLAWVQTAAVDVNIKVLGDGTIFDMVAAGVNEIAIVRQIGRFTNQYILTPANGLLGNKTTTVTITNQVASAFTIYGWSENQGNGYNQGLTQLCLAQSGVDFMNIAYLAAPASGATDLYTVTYRDGTNQAMRREEIRARLQRYQNVISATGFSADNIGKEIIKINLIPAAQQNVYVLKYIAASGNSASNSLIART